jgi:hypothetical protein
MLSGTLVRRSAAVVATTLLGSVLWASPSGSIHGLVRDPRGAVVTQAHITLVGKARAERRSAAPNAYGAFQFLDLAPGAWSLELEAPGFRRVNIPEVVVQVDRATRADIQLELGERTDVVEVSQIVPGIEKEHSTVQTVIDSRTIANMPLNGRQYLDLALLASGTVPAAPGTQGSGFSAGGIRSQSNVYLLDGVSNVDTQTNQPLNLFRITDAVREFAVQSGGALPEFGRGAGAQVNVVTKSGGNSLHGSIFEYLRNTGLTAADFFTNKLNGPKNALNRNQFGATAGAPIRQDRSFVFASYEGFRQIAPVVSSTLVPTPQQRATVTDPISERLLAFYPLPNASGAVNYIANVRNLDADDTGLVRIDHHAGPRDQLYGRWTSYWGSSTAAGPIPLSGGNTGPLSQVSAMLAETHMFSASWLNELRLGFSRYSVERAVQDRGFDAGTILATAGGVQLPGVPRSAGLPAIAISGGFAALGSNSNFPQGRTSNTLELFDNASLIVPFGAVRHTWRWGLHIRREDLSRHLDRTTRGSLNFANFADFARGQINSAMFRTGSTQSYWRDYPGDVYWQDEYRARDNLTLTFGVRYEYLMAIEERRGNATSFVPGYGPMIAGTNRVLDIDPSLRGPASIVFRSAPFRLPASGVYPDRNNVAPMFGFAYAPSRSGRTAIRGGIRMSYDELFGNVPTATGLAAPMSLQTTQTANVTQPGKFGWPLAFDQSVPLVSNAGQQGPGTPMSGVLSFQGLDPHLRSAHAYVYHFTIQRQAGPLLLDATYQGSAGRHLGMYVDANQPVVIVRDAARRGPVAPNEQIFPYQHFGQAQIAKSIGNSHYDGVTLSARRPVRRDVAVQVSYTFGKSLDYNSSYFGSGNQTGEPGAPIDARNLRIEHGPSAFDIRQRLTAFFVIDVPAPLRQSCVSRAVLGGWKVSGIVTLQTGAPFTVVTGGQDTSGFNQSTPGTSPNGGNRPNLMKNGPLPQDNRNPDAAFDQSWFGPNIAGQNGMSGRNQYYGPGMQNYNLSVGRSLPIPGRRDRGRVEARGDFFNLFNHTNFANPVADLSNVNFGRITQTLGSAAGTSAGATSGATGGPRIIQVSLRVEF